MRTFSGVILMCCIGAATAAAAQQGPVPIIVEYAAAPKSWEAAGGQAQVVAVVRLRTRSFKENAGERRLGPRLTTIYEADVVEILKNSGPIGVGQVLNISRLGGMPSATGASLIEEKGFPAWMPGTSLLVFLNWNPTQAAYNLTYGPDSSFELTSDGKIRTFGTGAIAKGTKGKAHEAVLREVRAQIR